MLELSVLVIEDQDLQQEMIVGMVRRLNTKEVYSAADSKKALEVVSSSSVDVIIYDIDMPAIDGLEFMRQLSEGGVRSSVIIASSIPPQLLAATVCRWREI
jgi:CheY-like chemotaxis protein